MCAPDEFDDDAGSVTGGRQGEKARCQTQSRGDTGGRDRRREYTNTLVYLSVCLRVRVCLHGVVVCVGLFDRWGIVDGILIIIFSLCSEALGCGRQQRRRRRVE